MDSSSTQALLKEGIAAAKAARQKPAAGAAASPEQINTRRKKARSLLARVLKADKHNVEAWLWLSTVVDTPQEQKSCFKNVLAVEPHNKYALAGLARLEQLDAPPTPAPPHVAKNYPQRTEPSPIPPPQTGRPDSRTSTTIQPAAAQVPATPSPSDASSCPFCREAISSVDSTCPHCRLLLVMNCPACGEAVEVERATCSRCGQKMDSYRQRAIYFAGLGEAYLKGQRYQDAVKAWSMVELLDRDFPQLHLRLGQSHLGLGRPDRATRSLQQALTQTPNSPEVHFILGELRRQQAAREEAFEHYQTVIRLDPNHGLAWLRTAEIFEQVGASKKAIQAYRRATRLLPANSAEYIQALAHLEKIEPKLPETMATGWSELIRQITGPILICLIAALFDAGLRPWWIPVTGWLALVLAPIGAFLFVSGSSLPRNPLLQMMVGKQGLAVKEYRTMVTIAGALLWLAAMALILLPINQSYPEIPDL